MTEIDARKAGLREAKKHPYLDRISYVNGYAYAVEQLPSREDIVEIVEKRLASRFVDKNHPMLLFVVEDAFDITDAVLALIRECYEGVPHDRE